MKLMVKNSAYQRLLTHKYQGTSNVSEFAAAARSRYNYLRQNNYLSVLSKAQAIALTKRAEIDEQIASLLDQAKKEIEKRDSKTGFRDSWMASFWDHIAFGKNFEFDPSVFETLTDEPLLFLLLSNEFDGNCGDLRDEKVPVIRSTKMWGVTRAELSSVKENFCLGRSVPILGKAKDWNKRNKNSFDIDLEMPALLFAACIKHAQMKGWQFTKLGWVEEMVLDGKLPSPGSMGELYVACDDIFDIIIAASLHTMGFDTFDARTGLRLDILSGYFGIFSFQPLSDELNMAVAVPFTNGTGFNYRNVQGRIPPFIKAQIDCTSEVVDADEVIKIAEAYFG